MIADPELSGGGGKATGASDSGWGEVYKPKHGADDDDAPPASEAPEEPDPTANTGIARLEVVGQTAIDVHPEGDLEDFYEARLRFGGEVDFRISRRLHLSIGTRIDFGWYAPFQGDRSLKRTETVPGPEPAPGQPALPSYEVRRSPLNEDRYEIDIIPLSAYVDATLADGVHLRVGEQVISLGRMDGISFSDMLTVIDLRPQAKADPAGLKLAQPAIRLDWDFNSWATLQLVYVPWFMPHLNRPNRDNYVGRAVTAGQADALPPTAISKLIDPSYQTRGTEEVLRFVGPAPDFRNPQAEARLNFRGSSFELALLGGTALEKLPAIYYAPLINKILLNGNNDDVLSAGVLTADGYSLIDVEYHRYYLVGIDGSFDIAPLQVGFELVYSPSRHFYTSDSPACARMPQICSPSLPLPDVSADIRDPHEPVGAESPTSKGVLGNVTDRSIRKGVQTVQAALHVEYLKGDSLLLAAEGYLIQTLALPHNKTRDWLGFPSGKGTYLAGLLTGSYNLSEGKYRFDLTMIVTMGPSYIVTPQIEVQVVDSFYLNVGAQFYEGPVPNNYNEKNRPATNLTPGGLFSGFDNVYVGFRWLP